MKFQEFAKIFLTASMLGMFSNNSSEEEITDSEENKFSHAKVINEENNQDNEEDENSFNPPFFLPFCIFLGLYVFIMFLLHYIRS